MQSNTVPPALFKQIDQEIKYFAGRPTNLAVLKRAGAALEKNNPESRDARLIQKAVLAIEAVQKKGFERAQQEDTTTLSYLIGWASEARDAGTDKDKKYVSMLSATDARFLGDLAMEWLKRVEPPLINYIKAIGEEAFLAERLMCVVRDKLEPAIREFYNDHRDPIEQTFSIVQQRTDDWCVKLLQSLDTITKSPNTCMPAIKIFESMDKYTEYLSTFRKGGIEVKDILRNFARDFTPDVATIKQQSTIFAFLENELNNLVKAHRSTAHKPPMNNLLALRDAYYDNVQIVTDALFREYYRAAHAGRTP
jgi:hypothetical protein